MRWGIRRSASVVAVLALLVSLVGASLIAPTPAGAAGTGTVQGTLTDSGSSGMLFRMVLRPTFGGAVVYDDVEIDPTGGPAGFALTGVPAGSYVLEALASSFGTFPAVFGQVQVTVTDGGTTVQNITADTRPACVSVTVKKSGGVPERVFHTSQPGAGGTNFLYAPASAQTSVTTALTCAFAGPFVLELWDPGTNATIAALAVTALPGETITVTIDLDNPPTSTVTTSGNQYARAYPDLQTGQSTIQFWRGSTQGVTLTFPVTCPSGVPSAVVLQHAGGSHPAAETAPGSGTWTVTLARSDIESGAFQAAVTCPGPTTVTEPLGRIVLFDPSGFVTDAVSGLPVAGASVELYEVPGWMPRPPDGAKTCESNTSKAPGAPWSQLAPTDEGVPATTAATEGRISPAIDTQLTDPDGHYGWDVSQGCWYVQVTADGYQPLTSPVVGVPPAVTDLDLALTPIVPAPADVLVTPGDGELGVSWTAPPGTILSSTVHLEPGNIDVPVAGAATSTTATGLTNGVEYTVTVRATVAEGDGPWSVPATGTPVAPPPPGAGFQAVTPFRALDSRDPADDWGGTPLGAGASRSLVVAGTPDIPADATAIVANVTVTGGTAASYLQAYPTGAAQPVTANLLFAPGQTVPNLVTVGVGTGGAVSFFNQLGSVHVIVDVVGYFDGDGTGDRFTGITPVRALDSRDAADNWGGMPIGPGQAKALKIGGADGVPSTATAVVANVTVTSPTKASFLQAYPTGDTQPVTANLLFAPGQTVPNLVTVGLGTNGQVTFFNQQGSTHVIVDVVAYFEPGTGDLFHPVTPVRVLDGRSNIGVTGPWGPNQSRSFAVAGTPSIPAEATGAIMNVTATGGTAASYLTVYPDGVTAPPTASLLFGPGQTIPNLVMVKLGATGGKAAIYNQQGSVHVIGDVAGYFAPPPAP